MIRSSQSCGFFILVQILAFKLHRRKISTEDLLHRMVVVGVRSSVHSLIKSVAAGSRSQVVDFEHRMILVISSHLHCAKD